MKNLCRLILLIFFLILEGAHAFKVHKGSDNNIKFIDVDGDRLTDYVISFKEDLKMIYWRGNDGIEQNISITGNKISYYMEEFAHKVRGRWQLRKRVKLMPIDSNYQQKIIEEKVDGKWISKSILSKTIQSEIDPMGYIPKKFESFIYTSDEVNKFNQKIFTASGDCLTYEIIEIGKKILENNNEEYFQIVNNLWEEGKIEELIKFNSCGDVCLNNSNVRDGVINCCTSENCTDSQLSRPCPLDMKKILRDSILNSIDCLHNFNQELTAQILGVIYQKGGFEKLKINCEINNRENVYLGSASGMCSKKPNINMVNVGCSGGNQKLISVSEYRLTLLHELIHHAGYFHGDKPDLTYSCQLACTWYGIDKEYDWGYKNDNIKYPRDENSISAAGRICRGQFENYNDDIALVFSQFEGTEISVMHLKHANWQFDFNQIENGKNMLQLYKNSFTFPEPVPDVVYSLVLFESSLSLREIFVQSMFNIEDDFLTDHLKIYLTKGSSELLKENNFTPKGEFTPVDPIINENGFRALRNFGAYYRQGNYSLALGILEKFYAEANWGKEKREEVRRQGNPARILSSINNEKRVEISDAFSEMLKSFCVKHGAELGPQKCGKYL